MHIIRSNSFEKNVKRYRKDRVTIERLRKQIHKIIENPEIGDFLTGNKKGERKIYIPPFRLLYAYTKKEDILYLLDFDKRDIIYKKKQK